MHIGIIGAGMIGSTMARLWVGAGHEIRLASRHPEALHPFVETLGPLAAVATPQQAARFGEVVMLTVPLSAMPGLAAELAPILQGKVVIDTGNAYEKRDGDFAREATSHAGGSAGWAAASILARWYGFNTVYFKVLFMRRIARDRVGIPPRATIARDGSVAGLVRRRFRSGSLRARAERLRARHAGYNTGISGRELREILKTEPGRPYCSNEMAFAAGVASNTSVRPRRPSRRARCYPDAASRRRRWHASSRLTASRSGWLARCMKCSAQRGAEIPERNGSSNACAAP